MKKILMIAALMMVAVTVRADNSLKQWLNLMPGGKMYGAQNVITFNDIAAASATAFDTVSIASATLVSGTTTLTLATGDYTDIIQPRNVVVVADFASGIASTTVNGTVTITGVNSIGNSVTETIAVSTNSTTGNVVYRSITSVAWTIPTVSGRHDSDTNPVLLKLGSGTKIGLPVDIVDTNDVKKCIEAGALTTSFTLNATYNSITFVNAPDGSKDYQLWIDNR